MQAVLQHGETPLTLAGIAALSSAISLKRIADALMGNNSGVSVLEQLVRAVREGDS